jgi:O-antigen ligase
LFFLPLLFLPDLGFRHPTAFGTLEIGDYLIFPYLVLLLFAKSQACPRYSKGLRYVLGAFLVWTLVGAVSINVRYDYGLDYSAMNYSLLKIAKLALYGLAGILTMERVKGNLGRREFHWSLLGVIAVMAMGLLLAPSKGQTDPASIGYIAINAIAVTVAFITLYCIALLTLGYGSKTWRRAAIIIVLLALIVVFNSGTRGAWLALIITAPYVMWRSGLRRRTIAIAGGFLMLACASYILLPRFKNTLDFTVNPALRYQTGETTDFGGIDEGGRPVTWLEEGPKFADAPVLGAGFFHRGGLSPLWTTGSHNFFLQMFLETGFVGGILTLLVFGRMWLDAGSRAAQQTRLATPLRAALIAAVVGGMGGEYFYGGLPVLALFLVYAPTGALPRMRRARVVPHVGGMAHRSLVEKRPAWVR